MQDNQYFYICIGVLQKYKFSQLYIKQEHLEISQEYNGKKFNLICVLLANIFVQQFHAFN